MPKGFKGFQKGHKRFAGVLFKKGEHSSVTTEFKKGHIGYIRTEKHKEQCRKMALANKKYFLEGVNTNSKEYKNYRKKIWAHKVGLNKKYLETPRDGRSYTKKFKRLYQKKYKLLKNGGGELTVGIIQLIYENNIKKYGTLTCYLCEDPIEFGQDSIEHKTPLSRNGTNNIDNLDIAHLNCNKKKHAKTEKEYRLLIGKC